MSSTAAEPGRPAPATTAAPLTDEAEATAIQQRAGYQPELRRSLRFFSMFAIAFSIISICPRTRSTRCAACRAACCGRWAVRWCWA